jgi:hypothetical protein
MLRHMQCGTLQCLPHRRKTPYDTWSDNLTEMISTGCNDEVNVNNGEIV